MRLAQHQRPFFFCCRDVARLWEVVPRDFACEFFVRAVVLREVVEELLDRRGSDMPGEWAFELRDTHIEDCSVREVEVLDLDVAAGFDKEPCSLPL